MGLCAGGIVLSTVVAHLAAKGEQDRIAGLTLGVTRARPAQRRDRRRVHGRRTRRWRATADSARKGYLERPLARGRVRVAAPERPDLELLGLQLPDGQDAAGVRHPLLERRRDEHARRRCTATSCAWRSRTRSTEPGRARRCSARRSTSSKITADTYVVAGIADHITPWQNAYRTVHLLGSRAALRALHERPHRRDGQPARQREGDLPGQRREPARVARGVARRARRTTPRHLVGRLGRPGSASAPAPRRPRRKTLGGAGHKPLGDAPGSYVLE